MDQQYGSEFLTIFREITQIHESVCFHEKFYKYSYSNIHFYYFTYKVILDIQIMLFVGFGFLMTFLRRFGYSAVCFTMLVTAVSVEYVVLVRGFM